MKILELDLRAIGPFTGVSVPLHGAPGLHLIFGPNEAGKSSTLRALRYAFFGFPPSLGDDFVHPYKNLRVGARLLNDAGEELAFLRRKARRDSLRDSDDDATVLHDDVLAAYLGRVDEAQFSTFFAIDHPSLVEGGREIVAGEGHVGNVLFSGSGVADLHAVQQRLENECVELFLPGSRAKRPAINAWLNELDATRQQIKHSELPVRDWEAHHQTLQRAETRKGEIEDELQEIGRERSRLERLQSALPLITERSELQTDLAALGDVVLLSADFHERRQQIETSLRIEESKRDRAAEAIAQHSEQISTSSVPRDVLAAAETIGELVENRGAYRKAARDLPGLQADLQQAQTEAGQRARDLGFAPDASPREARIPPAVRRQITRLSSRWTALAGQRDAAKRQVAELRGQLAQLESIRRQTPPSHDPAPLEAARHSALKAGTLEEQLATLRREIDTAREQAQIDLTRFPHWQGTLAELEALAAPTAETIDRFEHDFHAVESALADAGRRLTAGRKELAELSWQIDQLRLAQDVPTESRVQQARQQRDTAWLQICAAWKQRTISPEADVLLNQFERQFRSADDLSDRLRREAERVGRHSELEARIRKAEEHLHQTDAERTGLAARRRELEREWNNLWRPLGVTPLTPREMAAWRRQQQALIEQRRQIRRLEQQRDGLINLRDEHRTRLRAQLSAVAQSVPESASLTELLAAADQALARLDREATEARDRQRDAARIEADLQQAEEAAARAAQDLAAWQAEWERLLGESRLNTAAVPDEITELLELTTAWENVCERAARLRDRIDGIQDDAAHFETDVRRVVDAIAPDLAETPADQAVVQLQARLNEASEAKRQLERLTAERDAESARHAAAEQTIAELRSRLTVLCEEAGRPPEELADAEQCSDRRRQLEAEFGRNERQLFKLTGGEPLERLLEQARAVDADSLTPQLRQLADRIETLNSELKEQIAPQIGRERLALEQMESSSRAADAAESARDIVARIASGAEDYARLKLALAVLNRGIERYRERHQGPILGRAGELFARLTAGGFSGLQVDYEEGRPIVVGRRRGTGQTVGLTAMSDGTADQLYLAVRLAWLENWLESHEPIPFVVDDILIRFDDARSIETLKTLAELAQHTQVLFFTHHRHLIEMAQRHLSAEVYAIHDLPTPQPAAASA